MDMNGYSSDNVAFGQGGALLQMVNRDTLEFAMKCSAAMIAGQWVDVYKDPITSSMKKSKKGRLMLTVDLNTGEYVTRPLEFGEGLEDLLKSRWINGKVLNETDFVKVRIKSREAVH
jgi:nicotinamide phosphoribosyltransferase